MATQVPQSNRVHTKSQPHRSGTGLALISRVHERRQRPAARRPSGNLAVMLNTAFLLEATLLSPTMRAHISGERRNLESVVAGSRVALPASARRLRDGGCRRRACATNPLPELAQLRVGEASDPVASQPLIVAGVDASRTIAVAPAPRSGRRARSGNVAVDVVARRDRLVVRTRPASWHDQVGSGAGDQMALIPPYKLTAEIAADDSVPRSKARYLVGARLAIVTSPSSRHPLSRQGRLRSV